MVTEITTYWQGLPKGLKIGLVLSVLFHIGLAIALTIGLPQMKPDLTIPNAPVPVEIVQLAEETTRNKPPVKVVRPVEPEQAPRKAEKTIKAPPKVEAKEPPKIKPLEKPKPKKEETKAPEPDTPPPPSEVLEKPEPPPKPKKEESKKEAVQEEDPLASLMRNLQESDPVMENETDGQGADSVPDAPLAPTMTQNELSALTNQLVGCWQIPIGAKNIQNMIVKVRVWANTDRTVRKVEIANEGWMTSDPAFRALAESARRAVQSPNCSPLALPQDKVDFWKDKYIEVPFDPSKVI